MTPGWLQHPLTRGRDLDDPATTRLRRQVIAGKPFLRRLYREWYGLLARWVPPGPGRVVELGAGAGFLAEVVPESLASDLQPVPGLDVAADAGRLPFRGGSLRALLLVNVLHHLPSPAAFLAEAARVVRPGGVMAMVEPWNTPWARWVYRTLHHEPFEPAAGWESPPAGPLSGGNGALPWILCARDARELASRHPEWRLAAVEPLMPLAYLLSGGVGLRVSPPGWSFASVRWVERLLPAVERGAAMFAALRLERLDVSQPASEAVA